MMHECFELFRRFFVDRNIDLSTLHFRYRVCEGIFAVIGIQRWELARMSANWSKDRRLNKSYSKTEFMTERTLMKLGDILLEIAQHGSERHQDNSCSPMANKASDVCRETDMPMETSNEDPTVSDENIQKRE